MNKKAAKKFSDELGNIVSHIENEEKLRGALSEDLKEERDNLLDLWHHAEVALGVTDEHFQSRDPVTLLNQAAESKLVSAARAGRAAEEFKRVASGIAGVHLSEDQIKALHAHFTGFNPVKAL